MEIKGQILNVVPVPNGVCVWAAFDRCSEVSMIFPVGTSNDDILASLRAKKAEIAGIIEYQDKVSNDLTGAEI